MQQSVISVQFNNQSLLATMVNDIPHVALKPICENLGLDWDGQRQKIKRHPILSKGAVMITAPSNGGLQEMLMLPLKMLNGWLFGIDSTRVKSEIKDSVIKYQEECFDVLANHFMPKRNALVELPAVCVTPNEKLQLQKMINARVHRTKESHSMAWHILFDAYRVNKMECLPTGRVDEMCAYMGERVPHQDEMVLIKKHELDELKTAAAQVMRLPKGSVVIDETYLKTLHHGVIERDAFQIKSMIEKHGGLLLWQEQIDVLKSVLKLD